VEDHLGDLLRALKGDAVALLDGERMAGVSDGESWPFTNDLSLDVDLKVDGIAEDKDLRVEVTRKRRIIFAAGRVPSIVDTDEVGRTDLGPDTPDERIVEAGDGDKDAAAEIEAAVVDYALVGRDDDALFAFGGRNVHDCPGMLETVLQG